VATSGSVERLVADRSRFVSFVSARVGDRALDPTAQPIVPLPPRRVCEWVRGALDRLRPKARRILEAVELEGMTPSKFGIVEGISSGNAAVRWFDQLP